MLESQIFIKKALKWGGGGQHSLGFNSRVALAFLCMSSSTAVAVISLFGVCGICMSIVSCVFY